MKTIRILILLFCFTFMARGAQLDLSGVVAGSDGTPLPKAMVFIYTAGPKHGSSGLCPSCYADCSKKAQSDAQGHFVIPALDPALVFRVLAVAAGHENQFVTKVDPAKGELKISLKPLSAEAMNSPLRVKGLIIGEDGQPIANATIGPEGASIGSETHWGGTDDYLDPVAVSDEQGHFVLHCKTNVLSIFARARGLGVAEKWVEFKPGGDYVVRMEEGVAVTGRLVCEGQPLPDISVDCSTTDRVCGKYLDCAQVATRSDGRFLIPNVPPGREFFFCASMDSLRGHGAIAPKSFKTDRSGTTLDLGDIQVKPGHRLEGKIELSDGKPIPPGTMLMLSRSNVRDISQQELGPDGSFKFTGVPAESLGINVRVKGYIFSKRNPSLDWLNGGIVGKLDGDTTGLILLLEPGQWKFNNHPDNGPADGDMQPTKKPLRSVSANGVALR